SDHILRREDDASGIQGMGRYGSHQRHGRAWRYDRTAAGEAVSGGAGGRRYDDAVGIIGIQILVIYVILESHHTKRAFTADHNIIQGHVMADDTVSPVNGSGKHHAVLDLIVVPEQLIQSRKDGLAVHFRQETESAEVHSQHGNLPVYHVSGSLEQGSVPSQNKYALRPLRYQVRIRIMIASFLFPFSKLYLAFFAFLF